MATVQAAIAGAEHVLSGAGRALAGTAHLVARREVLTGADIDALNRTIANVRATLDEVEAETGANRTSLTIPGATWDDQNVIAAERAASTGPAS